MNELMVFNNPEFGKIRTVEVKGEPWLVGKDVAVALGYSNTSKAIIDHVDEEDKRFEMLLVSDSRNGNLVKTAIINESGLYSLVLSSKLPGAKKFKRWVTSEVLPSIRRNGGYISNQDSMSPEELMAKALMVAQKTLAEREARLSSLTVENQIMAPKAAYFDELVDRNLLTNFRETAKQLNVPPKKFVSFLLDRKYIYRDKRGKLLPYEDKNNGLFEVKETFNEKTQWSGTQTMVTPKGRETFRLLCIA
ncbi:MAG: phage antirepressor KilAC domain-containing protein [Clostridiales bacterium]|nr:phage antirepressor KilAC domain-containing protein [Clostridiales bacterium]